MAVTTIFQRLTLGTFASIMMLWASDFQPIMAQQSATSQTGSSLTTRTVIQGTGLPVPRFVSLKSAKVNMRVGPGREYPLDWVYVRSNLPVKVIAEFDVWRKIIDHEGSTGWVHGQLVSLKRHAIITEAFVKLRRRPSAEADAVAIAEKDVVMEIQFCEKEWCKLASDEVKGWALRSSFWGMLEGEVLN
ncbi:MAG: Uncharacterised protein [Alphaproteobacteria bacterium UBA4588]|nr:MAG: Uncharacterised protein [Alphaproteobacteria bacterium UBA4588]